MSQSLSSGQIIDKPYIYDKYFPLPFCNKYIVFAPQSKDSKNYDYWQDVLHIIVPILNKNDIKIVQVGSNGERPYPGCHHTMGNTNVNQVSFLIKKSIGVLSTDTFAHHIADSHNIKSVMLCSNNYKDNVKGYFHPENQIIFEPPREAGDKPCLSLQENPKSINLIKCEDIAKAVCKMLDIEYNYSYDTIYLGAFSFASMLETACDSVVDPRQFGAPSLIIRLDYNFNEQILSQQMQISDVSIFTNKAIDINLMKTFRPRIKELVFNIDSIDSPNISWVKEVQKLGIPMRLITSLSEESINTIKLDFWEIGVINYKLIIDPLKVSELKDEKLDDLFVKSSKITIGRGKLYNSKAAYLLDKSIGAFEEISPIINNKDFWDDLPSFRILKKTV
jgi:hypothetical protein